LANRGGLSSDAKCNTPRRFGIGKVVQDLKECCHAADAGMARYVPQLGGLGFVAAIFRRMAEDRRGNALLFAGASNRPHDRARDFSLVGILIAVSIERS